MSRYIDAEIAVEIINRYRNTIDENGKTVADAIIDILKVFTPTADVVSVVQCENCKSDFIEPVRCRDCTHGEAGAYTDLYCEYFDWGITADDFCSYGERRDEK